MTPPLSQRVKGKGELQVRGGGIIGKMFAYFTFRDFDEVVKVNLPYLILFHPMDFLLSNMYLLLFHLLLETDSLLSPLRLLLTLGISSKKGKLVEWIYLHK